MVVVGWSTLVGCGLGPLLMGIAGCVRDIQGPKGAIISAN